MKGLTYGIDCNQESDAPSYSNWLVATATLVQRAWQEGYAAFSVSAISREAVKHYIANQEEHHRVKSFREELVEMLNKAGVEYDPKYLD